MNAQEAFTKPHGERGMVSVWVAVAMVAFIVIVGLGVDFAGHAAASQDARGVAAEAARAGGQHLTMDSGRARPDVNGAIRAANAYVAGSPYSGSTNVRGGDTVTVTVTGRYSTQFLSIIGIDALALNETGSATVTSVLGGTQQ
ncbi:hypothetical protein BW730_14350 [Tessaracoccus aquimaris]|uniref:Uncharacterized protein n=1 Tax=Tessaracoccus aquimaris TaxID=1332264 RepID=A0A1Q2CQY1_9ACTN|nr:hypothetical protein [Tessaracoccus aquimaris]AQP48512.1 hypothetical protein BW730_14350 [Tessaracoccus aquimaris]